MVNITMNQIFQEALKQVALFSYKVDTQKSKRILQ